MKIDILDQGYVRFVEAWGHGDAGHDPTGTCDDDNEVGIVEAARQSTQAAFRGWDQDTKLLRTLALSTPPHGTPFEFAGLVVEVQAPIMVFREWHRHRTQSYNEMSARYAPLPDLYYLPAHDDVVRRGRAAEQSRNKQLQGVAPFNEAYVAEWLQDVEELYQQAECIYQGALANGIPKELARITMPVGHYSRMRAGGNLRNWLAFLELRTAKGVMEEMRLYAGAMEELIKATFPHCHRLFVERVRPLECGDQEAPR